MTRSTIHITLVAGALLVFGGANVARANTDMIPDPGPRIRLALDVGAGIAIGDSEGGAFNVAGQLGIQFNDLFALYYQPALFIDGWASRHDTVEYFLFGSNLGMLDFTMARWFQLGVGAGVDAGQFSLCANVGEDVDCIHSSGEVQPALEGRLVMIVPLLSVRARWGLPVTFRFHTTFFDNRQIHSATLSLGLMRY